MGSLGFDVEELNNYSVGFIYLLIVDFNLIVDFYCIDIDDCIVLFNNLLGEGIEVLFVGMGVN